MEPWRAKRIGRAERRRVARERAAYQVANLHIRKSCYAFSYQMQLLQARRGYGLFYNVPVASVDTQRIHSSSAGIDGWSSFAAHIDGSNPLEQGCIQKQSGEKVIEHAALPIGLRRDVRGQEESSSARGTSRGGGGKSRQSVHTRSASRAAGSTGTDSIEDGLLEVQPIRFQPGTYPVKGNDPSFRHWKIIANQITIIGLGIRKIFENSSSRIF